MGASLHRYCHSRNYIWSCGRLRGCIAAQHTDKPTSNSHSPYILIRRCRQCHRRGRHRHLWGTRPRIWDARNGCRQWTGCRRKQCFPIPRRGEVLSPRFRFPIRAGRPRPYVRPIPTRNLVHAPPEHADGQVVLVLAGDLAGFAAGAGGGVEGEGVGHVLRLRRRDEVIGLLPCVTSFDLNHNRMLCRAKGEGVQRSEVSTLMQPPKSTPFSFGIHHAPWGMSTTPGRMRGVTRAGMTSSPRSFQTRTRSPSWMSRSAASMGLMKTRCGKASFSQSLLAWVEWTRARVWWPMAWKGYSVTSETPFAASVVDRVSWTSTAVASSALSLARNRQ